MSGVELAVLAVASSAVSAYAGIQAAKAQKAQYDAQAALTEKKGRQEALAYKQKGVEVLKNMNKALAATTARAGAGNIDPFSSGDSPDIIMGYTMRAGTNDFTITRDNASLTQKYAKFQADNYRYAGREAVRTAKVAAVAQIGMSVAQAGFMSGSGGFTGGNNLILPNSASAPGGATGWFGSAITPTAAPVVNTAPALSYTPSSVVTT